MMAGEKWKPEVIRWVAENLIEIKAPWDLPEGALTLFRDHDHVEIDGVERRINMHHDDSADEQPVRRGDLIQIGLLALEA